MLLSRLRANSSEKVERTASVQDSKTLDSLLLRVLIESMRYQIIKSTVSIEAHYRGMFLGSPCIVVKDDNLIQGVSRRGYSEVAGDLRVMR